MKKLIVGAFILGASIIINQALGRTIGITHKVIVPVAQEQTSDCFTTYAGKTVCQWRGNSTTYQQYNGYNHYKWW